MNRRTFDPAEIVPNRMRMSYEVPLTDLESAIYKIKFVSYGPFELNWKMFRCCAWWQTVALEGNALKSDFEMRRVVQGLDTLQVMWITKRDGSDGKTLICRKVESRLENELCRYTALPLWIHQWNLVDGCVGFSQAKTCHQLSFPSFQACWKWCQSTSIDDVPAR